MPRKAKMKPRIQARAKTNLAAEVERFTVTARGEPFKAFKQSADGAGVNAYASEDGSAGAIDIYGVVGTWECNAEMCRAALRQMPKATRIDVTINSPGGDVFDGFAIYEMLRSHDAEVHVKIEGLAASIASVIAMAGDTIEIAENGFMMIHNAWAFAIGNAAELRETANILTKIDKSIARTYAKRTGKTIDAMAEAMDAETWYDSEDAVEAGLADQVSDSVEAQALAHDVSFFAKTPDVLRKAARKRSAAAPKPVDKAPAPAASDCDLAGILAEIRALTSTIKGPSKNERTCSP